MKGAGIHEVGYVSPGLIFLLLGLLTLLWIPVPSHTSLWKAFNNFCHVPLFAGMAVILLYLMRQIGEPRGWSVPSHYAGALMGVVVLGVMSEAIQIFTPGRSPEVSDILWDIVGGICALGVWGTFDHGLTGKWRLWREGPRKQAVRGIAGLVALAAMSPVIMWGYASWDRANRFPSLCDFSSPWEMLFVQVTGSELSLVPPPLGWKNSQSETVGKVTFHPSTYPGIRINEPSPDWRGYDRFSLEVYSELPEPQKLSIRIDDAHHNQEHADRFNRAFLMAPGLNHIQIPLEDILQAPAGRTMDLSSIKTIIIFAVKPAKAFSLYFDNLRLE